MKKLFIGSLISISLALLALSILNIFIVNVQKISFKDIKYVKTTSNISNSINIKDKVIKVKSVTNTNYIESWKLTATVLGSPSYAMVVKGRIGKVLEMNDTLEDYQVKKIEKHKVLFSNKTENIWLYMKTKKYKNINVKKKVMPIAGHIVMRQAYVKKYLKKPERLLKTVNIMPKIESGVFNGFVIKSLLEGSFLYNYGLRKGDIIKKINGKKLVSMSDGISGYESMSSSRNFSISILRDNKIRELKYEIVK